MNKAKLTGLLSILFLLLSMGGVSAVFDDADFYLSFDNDDLSGSNPLDISGNGISTFNNGATTGVTGEFFEAFSYNGDDWVNTTTANTIISGASAFTMNFDLKIDSIATNQFIIAGPTSMTVQLFSSVIYFDITGSQRLSFTATNYFTNGVYSRVSIVYNGSETGNDRWRIYVDGVLTTGSYAGTMPDTFPTTNSLGIGTRLNDFYLPFTGDIDEFSLYSYAFSASQVSAYYNLTENPYSGSPSTNLTVTVLDEWDNTAVNNVTLTLTNGTSYTNSTGNVIRTDIPLNESVLLSYNLSSTNYLTKTFSNINISTSQTNDLFQSYVVFNASTILNESVPYTQYIGVSSLPSAGYIEINYTVTLGSTFVNNFSIPPLCMNSTGGFTIANVLNGVLDRIVYCENVLGSNTTITNFGFGSTVNSMNTFYAQNSTWSVNGTGGVAFPVRAGTYEVTATANGFYTGTSSFSTEPLNTYTITSNGLYNHLLTLIVQDAVLNYTLNYSGVISNGFYDYNFNTTNGTVYLPAMQLATSTITLDPITGYATNNLTFDVFMNSSNASTFIHGMYQNNSIYITLLDSVLSPFLQNTTITLYSNFITYIFSTTTGFLYEDEIIEGTYIVSTATNNFSALQQITTLNNGESQNLEFVFVSDLVSVRLTVIDNLGKLVDDAIITATYIVNGSSVVQSVVQTDLSGSSLINLNPDQLYTITVAKAGYETFIGDLQPTLLEYNINIIQDGANIQLGNINDILLSYDFYNYNATTQNGTLEFNINSPYGVLQFWGYYYTINNVTTTVNQSNPNGGNIQSNITVPNSTSIFTINYFFKKIGDSTTYTFNISYYLLPTLENNNLLNTDWNIPETAKPIIAMFIILGSIGAGLTLSREPTVPIVMGLIGVGVCVVLGAVSIIAGSVTLVVGIVLLVSEAKRI